jgi:hypothetical protein
MTDKPTQADRVLMSLVQAGSQGVTQGDWLAPTGADGLGRITRVAARVGELREDGLNVVTEGERDGFSVYVLRAAPKRVVVDSSGSPAGSLFEAAPARPRTSAYFDEAA